MHSLFTISKAFSLSSHIFLCNIYLLKYLLLFLKSQGQWIFVVSWHLVSKALEVASLLNDHQTNLSYGLELIQQENHKLNIFKKHEQWKKTAILIKNVTQVSQSFQTLKILFLFGFQNFCSYRNNQDKPHFLLHKIDCF